MFKYTFWQVPKLYGKPILVDITVGDLPRSHVESQVPMTKCSDDELRAFLVPWDWPTITLSRSQFLSPFLPYLEERHTSPKWDSVFPQALVIPILPLLLLRTSLSTLPWWLCLLSIPNAGIISTSLLLLDLGHPLISVLQFSPNQTIALQMEHGSAFSVPLVLLFQGGIHFGQDSHNSSKMAASTCL